MVHDVCNLDFFGLFICFKEMGKSNLHLAERQSYILQRRLCLAQPVGTASRRVLTQTLFKSEPPLSRAIESRICGESSAGNV